MRYCTQQDLIDRFSEEELLRYADRDEDGSIDSTVIDQAITDAGEEIDAYLGARYPLPLPDPVPALLGRLCADIARYRLQDDAPLDETIERYKQAITQLRDIVNGKAMLRTATLVDGGLNVSGSKTDSDRVFTRETLADF
jgi:phage gp36-like protein